MPAEYVRAHTRPFAKTIGNLRPSSGNPPGPPPGLPAEPSSRSAGSVDGSQQPRVADRFPLQTRAGLGVYGKAEEGVGTEADHLPASDVQS